MIRQDILRFFLFFLHFYCPRNREGHTNQALTQRNARAAPTRTTNDRYTFRTWLLRLGMIGPEFETARFHLLSHLEGNIAWRDPSQLIREQEEQTQHAPAQEPVPAPGLSL